MRVAIVHYHLRSGGVFRVVRNTLAAFADRDCQFGILVGEAPGGDQFPDGSFTCVPELCYAGEGPETTPQALAETLKSAATTLLGGPPDLWHVHNHSLGKNFVLPPALRLLAESGERLLLQIHDFAEDGRPNNFRQLLAEVGGGDFAELSRQAYPLSPNVHYGVLNGRDETFLRHAGAPDDQVHLLSNPVSFGEAQPENLAGQGEFILYPTRAIRRKNLGEFLLLRMLDAHGDRRWAVTMAPENPVAKPFYEHWVDLSQDLGLDIEFEWGSRSGLPFPDLIAASQFLVTTSVAEGFGLAFLEPWLMGKQIFGRDLEEVTRDFAKFGIDLSTLYTQLPVRTDSFDFSAFRERAGDELSRYYQHYGQPLPDNALQRFLDDSVNDGTIDFARIDEPAQDQVLRNMHDSAQRPPLSQFLEESQIGSEKQVRENREIVEENFSLAAYAQRLTTAYDTLLGSPTNAFTGNCLDSQKILEQFLAPERFLPIRT